MLYDLDMEVENQETKSRLKSTTASVVIFFLAPNNRMCIFFNMSAVGTLVPLHSRELNNCGNMFLAASAVNDMMSHLLAQLAIRRQ